MGQKVVMDSINISVRLSFYDSVYLLCNVITNNALNSFNFDFVQREHKNIF
jgi:hypothetical protein